MCRHRPLLRHPAAERAQSVSRRRPTTPRQPTPVPRSHGRAPRSSSGRENVRADGRRTPVQSSRRLFTEARRRALHISLALGLLDARAPLLAGRRYNHASFPLVHVAHISLVCKNKKNRCFGRYSEHDSIQAKTSGDHRHNRMSALMERDWEMKYRKMMGSRHCPFYSL